ncbi:MAG: DNA helicase PcrA [Actinobacteria bacterium]|nr:DNA helicase PcrA [Actinomycetota bacterium]
MIKDKTQFLEQLNHVQREAVAYKDGPLLIIAGAGSGKTRVLTYRVAYLVKYCGVSPWDVLALTFTNKAAGEMKERIQNLIGIPSRDMMIGTFHSMCARILRREIEVLGYSPRFSIYDEADANRLIAQCLDEEGFDRRTYHPRAIKAAISRAKSEMVDPDTFGGVASNMTEEVTAQVYRRYQERLKENNAVDFDDLLLLTVNIMELYPDVLEKYRQRFKHILVDEYQDTNTVQYHLVKLIAEKHGNLTVVGDDDQGIYSWRGADIRNILEFEQDFPNAHVIKLEQNYRSTQTILRAANAVIKQNAGRKEKTLWTDNPEGELVRYHQASDEHGEAAMVAVETKRLVEEKDRNYSDTAVFYRTHAQSRVIEEALIRLGIPYRIFGGTRFYERQEIKDIVAYLRVIANPSDEVSLRRIINVPTRGIGKTTIGHAEKYSRDYGISLMNALREAKEIPGLSARAAESVKGFIDLIDSLVLFMNENDIGELIKELWGRTGYMRELEAERTLEADVRIENLQELLGVVEEFKVEYGSVSLDDFLERVSLVGDTDEMDESGGYVSLMSLHNAKGLEFPFVFMTGMEEGIFPHIRSMEDPMGLEEERRLCYVGMTRACEALYVSHAECRSLWGGLSSNPVSRFLAELPGEYLEEQLREEGAVLEPGEELDLAPGDVVSHAKWGRGTVLELIDKGDDSEVVVEFTALGTKRLLLCYAPLRKMEG